MEQQAHINLHCSMCFFECITNKEMLIHYVRNHRNDPQFKVICTVPGCGVTFKRWRTFRTHLLRKHRENSNQNGSLEDIPIQWNLVDIANDIGDTEEENEDESTILELNAAKFILNIRENCKIAHNAITHIIDGVKDLIDDYLLIILKQLKNKCDHDTQQVNFNEIENIFKNFTSSLLFPSKKQLDLILIEKLGMVLPQKLSISTGLKWKKQKDGKFKICNISYDAYIVPVLDNLEKLINNKQVYQSIENPRPAYDGVYRTILDGSYYREHEHFKNKNSLAIIMYYDDICLANPLGSSSKIHKMAMFYWTLANIPPEFRSTLNVIQLYAIVKLDYLKKPNAFEKLMEPFISAIKKLQTHGIYINVNGVVKNYRGSLIFCAADTPAAALLGGFKESVSAYRMCRSCTTTSEEWKNDFRDSNFQQRTQTNHGEHLKAVCDQTITKAAREFWRKMHGVNNKSPLTDIIDVSKCLPQDIMHILIEGPLQMTCKFFLRYCIFELNLFTVDEFNNNLTAFDFKHFKKDKPSQIQREHLTDENSLRQTAGQMITLGHTLLFIIGEWILPCDDEKLDEHIYCFVTLLQIMNICLAYEIHENSVDLLTRMIEVFNWSFMELYPDCIVPKFHFLIHVPRYIRLFGPARQQWCFRFEAAHAYYKGLVTVVKNFKNLALTLSYRHQARLCSRLASHSGIRSKKFLYQNDDISPKGEILLLRDLAYASIFREIVNEANWFTCQLMRTHKITILGTSYCSKSIVLLEYNEDEDPVFGEVHEIFILNDLKLLVLSILETVNFEFKLNAYHVKYSVTKKKCLKNICDLIFPYPLSSFMVGNDIFIPIINHERVEFCG